MATSESTLPRLHVATRKLNPVNIYVDESGTFAVPASPRRRVCCLAGLVLPSKNEGEIFFEFLRLKDCWGLPAGEVKGSGLNETQVAAVLSLLSLGGAMVHIIATDMKQYSSAELDETRTDQADRLLKDVSPGTHIYEKLHGLRDSWLRTSNQLFLQSMLTIFLVEELLQTATLFFVLRRPDELGSFKWRFDAKDRSITESERVWSELVMPLLQTRSIEKPHMTVAGEDYSHFRAFQVDETTAEGPVKETLEWLKSEAKRADPETRGVGVNLNLILADLKFEDSRNSPGIQLADIVASACARAFNGNLLETGWSGLSSLVVARTGGSVHFIEISARQGRVGTSLPLDEPLAKTLRRIDQNARSMWPRASKKTAN